MSARFEYCAVQRLLLSACVLVSAIGNANATGLPQVQVTVKNQVPGCVTPARLMTFLRARNSRLPERYGNIARYYASYGRKLNLRWDVSFFQMMVETANLTFRRPNGRFGDVRPEDNNFAGLGAVGDGRPGERFPTIQHGVRAHLEHVLHYAGVAVLSPVAERTRKVQAWRTLADWHQGFTRPITFSDLALRWAPHTRAYLASIEQLAGRYQDRFCAGQQLLLVHARARRAPEIAETAWRFEKGNGGSGSVGPVPPTGKPDFSSGRKTLGASNVAAISNPQASAGSASWRPVIVSPPKIAPRRRAVPQTATRPPRRQVASVAPVTRPAVKKRPRLSRNDLVRQMVSDKKILLRTHVGSVIPIVFRKNGRMSGEAGGLGFFLGSSRDRGRWWVAKGKLCQKWRIWLDRETHCISLKKHRGKIWWRSDDGKSGTARIVSR